MQRTEDQRKGTKTRERDGLEIMDWTEGQMDWRAGNVEKLKPVAERSRETAERHGMVESADTGSDLGLEGRERVPVTAFSAPGMWTMSLVNSEM